MCHVVVRYYRGAVPVEIECESFRFALGHLVARPVWIQRAANWLVNL